MPSLPTFASLAAEPDPGLDVLALALAAEFRDVDADGALRTLDALGAELARDVAGRRSARAQAQACARLLGEVHAFEGDRRRYDDPDNSMLDLVLERRRGLPILLSVVYVEVARRAGLAMAGIGLHGHFVVGHFAADPPVLLDPFAGGTEIRAGAAAALLRPWRSPEVAMRILNNLTASYTRRGNIAAAIRAARMRLALPCESTLREALERELRVLHARMN